MKHYVTIVRKKSLWLAVFVIVSGFSGCGGGGGNNNPVTTPTLTTITIFVNTTTELRAIGTYLDGSQKDISTQVTWMSSDITVATVDPTGKLIMGSTKGVTYITASVGDLSSQAYPITTLTGTTTPSPSAPTGVTATAGDGTVTISWSAVSGATSYNLYMASQTGVTKSNYSSLADGMIHAGVTSPFVHAGLTNGKTYYFVVTAANAGGESTESQQASATPIKPVTKISAGGGFTCAILTGGNVKCWGNNDNGQLGIGTNTGPDACTAPPATGSLVCSKTPVSVFVGGTVTDIAAGFSHACVILSGGMVECWGSNGFGQLGNGSTTDSYSAVSVSGINNAIGIATGGIDIIEEWGGFTCALLLDGTVKCWGGNMLGQLGNGTTTDSLSPVTVSGISNAVSISAGYEVSFACALLSDRTVKCWGSNGSGQLGDGTNTASSIPVSVLGINNAVRIDASGGSHACALLSNGTIKCWGLNVASQLGDGTTTTSATPVVVSGINNATDITVGDMYTCAVLADKSVKCWGGNYYGQLGNGTITTNAPTAVSVSMINNAVSVEAGGTHTCALLTDGTAKCWGTNLYGEFGTGTNTGPDSCPVTSGGAMGLNCSATPVSVSNTLYAFFHSVKIHMLAYVETLVSRLKS